MAFMLLLYCAEFKIKYFVCRSEVLNYTTDINALLLVYHTDGYSLCFVHLLFYILTSGQVHEFIHIERKLLEVFQYHY